MLDVDMLQTEIKKTAASLKALENLHGRIPEEELEKAKIAYQSRLQALINKLKQSSESQQREDEDSYDRPVRATVAIGAIGQLYRIYADASHVTASLNEEKFRQLLSNYLQWILAAYLPMRLYGLECVHMEGSKLVRKITDMYVPPSFVKSASRRVGHYIGKEKKVQEEIISLTDLLVEGERLAVEGRWGDGKSTLLAYLAANLAANAQTGKLLPFNLPDEKSFLLPLIIPLRGYWKYFSEQEKAYQLTHSEKKPKKNIAEQNKTENISPLQDSIINLDIEIKEEDTMEKAEFVPPSLVDYIIWYLKGRTPNLAQSEDFFKRLLIGGTCLVMLDGLDEIPNRQKRYELGIKVEELIKTQYSNNVFLLTARSLDADEDANCRNIFTRFYIQPFDEHKVEKLVVNWCNQINPRKARALSTDIMHVIGEVNTQLFDPNLPALIESPLMVCLMISIRLVSREWPMERTKLFDTLISVALQSLYLPDDPERIGHTEWGGTWEQQRDWLSTLAFEMHRGGENTIAIPESRLRNFLMSTITSEDSLTQYVTSVRERGGLLYESSESFTFSHQIFQIFLAARVIVRRQVEIFSDLEFLVGRPWWREILLLAYEFAYHDHPQFAKQYLEWLNTQNLPGQELSGAAILRVKDVDLEVYHFHASKLATVLTDKSIVAMPQMRAQAGNTLARLGDTRFSKDIWYLPDDPMLGFIKIPGGSYLIGSSPERDKDSNSKEAPLHEVGMLTYYLAKYPVTVAQWRAFISETNYKNVDPNSLKGLPNHPVVFVTWDDALIYCRWLEYKLSHWDDAPQWLAEILETKDWKLTLPSEPEWEAAAAGVRSRPYPWGSQFDPKRTNTVETQIGTTTAVGIFPPGASPFGAMDMSGNVWEWTRSLYRIYYYTSDDGREDHSSRDFRVLRGGSFLNNRLYARCPYRNMYYPDFKDENIGFRIALYQVFEYEEIKVPLKEGDEDFDPTATIQQFRTVLVRKKVVIAGPRRDR